MKTLLNLLPNTRHRPRQHPPKPTGGYTMIELLVGMVIAALIITPLLTFVVNILNSDVREQAKTNSEQELQAAIDYIAHDISQAVYIYDDAGVTAIADELPGTSDGTTRTPVLAFWKREYVADALSPLGDICSGSDCNDTFVMSLVAYYLVEDSSTTWCEPAGSCKRIGRFQIKDGVKDLKGDYVCADSDTDTDGRSSDCEADSNQKEFQRDLGYSSFDNSNPTGWTKTGEDYTNDVVVLVNYIEDFQLSNPTLITNSDNKLAEIEIQSNALRSLQVDTNCASNSSYCPQATARVGARSGFGTSQ